MRTLAGRAARPRAIRRRRLHPELTCGSGSSSGRSASRPSRGRGPTRRGPATRKGLRPWR
eukprot:1436863-Lingulodinium_polyedra.AAC.1